MSEKHSRVCVRIPVDLVIIGVPLIRGIRHALRSYPDGTSRHRFGGAKRPVWVSLPPALHAHLQSVVGEDDMPQLLRVGVHHANHTFKGWHDPAPFTLEWINR